MNVSIPRDTERATICIYEYIECSFHERVELFLILRTSTSTSIRLSRLPSVVTPYVYACLAINYVLTLVYELI